MLLWGILLLLGLATSHVLAQEACHTPTAYPTWTPYTTPSPFPTDYVLAEDNLLVSMNSSVVSFTAAMSNTADVAYTYVPSLSQSISSTAIAFPVHVIRGLMTEFPFFTTGFALVFGFMIYRFVLLGVFAIIKQTGGIRNAIGMFWAMIQPHLNWKDMLIFGFLASLPVLVYQCNVQF